MSHRFASVLALALGGCGGDFDYDETCDDPDVSCGTVTVPARHDRPEDGRTYEIGYLIQHARRDRRAVPDPLVLFNGGPGSTTPGLHMLLRTYLGFIKAPGKDISKSRDVILIDVRGVETSQPDLRCPELADVYAPAYSDALSLAEIEALRRPAIEACAARFAGDGVDLNDFSSLQAAHDAATVMQALGYDTWNAWGVSYGTIIAQHLARHYPEQTRTLILDSVASPAISVLEEAARSGSLALDRHLGLCAGDRGCARDFPSYREDLFRLVDVLGTSPAQIPTVDPYTGQETTYPMDGHTFLLTFAGMLTSQHFQARGPRLVQDLLAGDPSALEGPRSGLFYDDGFVDFWTITSRCTEQVDFVLADALVGDALLPGFADALEPILEEALSLCDPLGIELMPPEERAPLSSDVPALLFAGEVDITTPPWMAEAVAEGLPNAIVHTVPATGHVAISNCTWTMMEDFMDDPASAPDAGCLEKLEVNFKGPGCATGPVGRPWALLAPLALLAARRRR